MKKEAFDELEKIFEQFHSDATGANISGILNRLFYQLSDENIERLKIIMRSEVADKFEVFGEFYDREQLLSNFSYLGRAIRLFSGYYMGKEAVRKNHIRLNDVLMACCAGSQAFDQTVTKVFQAGNIDVYTDEVALFQIIRNLLSNALEATDIDRENRITIRTYLSNDSNFVFIQIEDHGVGIPEGNLSHLFVPGFTTKEKGKGLGLAIVKDLVEGRCNGTIKFQSKVGSGTIFTICLPIL